MSGVNDARQMLKRKVPVSLYGQKVRVYRNLNFHCLSIMQGGIVIGHAVSVSLKDVEFVVNERGRKQAADSGVKNVHAFAEGVLVQASDRKWALRADAVPLRYAGPKSGKFVHRGNGLVVSGARELMITIEGMAARGVARTPA